MSVFELLGLADDADERAIKRAYAQRLRTTRPEDDPEGFQRLHAAYQAALEYSRKARTDETDGPLNGFVDDVVATRLPETSPTQNAVRPSHVQPDIDVSPAPRFNMGAFCVEAFEQARTRTPQALHTWLTGQQAGWSFELKAQIGHFLVTRLYALTPPMASDRMECLLRFFDLDHALAGHDPLALQQLMRRSHLAWQLEITDTETLGLRLNLRRPVQRWQAHWIVRLLKRPFSWRRVLFVGLNSSNANLIVKFVQSVNGSYPEDLPASINREQLNFWLSATDPRQVTSQRLALGAARAVAMLALSVPFAIWLSYQYTAKIGHQLMLMIVGMSMISSALWALWMAWLQLSRWHTAAKAAPSRLTARACVVPSMCLGGLVLNAYGHGQTGLILLVPAMVLALLRYAHHRGIPTNLSKSAFFRLGWALTIPLLYFVLLSTMGDIAIPIDEIMAAAAVLLWSRTR